MKYGRYFKHRYGIKTIYKGVEYRSMYEANIAKEADKNGILSNVEYEQFTVPYKETLVRNRRYTPDFTLTTKTGKHIYIEAKKAIDSEQKRKFAYMSKNKILDLRFIFSNPGGKMPGCKKETYASWAKKIGAKWAKTTIPMEWYNE
jgi:hypothetical protein